MLILRSYLQMSNIPYLAARLEKRSGKVESFNIVKKIIKGESVNDSELATIYSYFLPPKSKKISNIFDWLTIPCDKDSSYAFCKYVLVNDGCVQSANTSVAHIVFSDLNLDNGFWYDTQKENVGDDIAIMPNIFDALSNSQKNGIYENFNLESLNIKDTFNGLCYVLPWNGKGVDKQYFDAMFKSLDNVIVSYTENGAFTVMGNIGKYSVCSVIMPFTVTEI